MRFSETRKGFVNVRGKEDGGKEKKSEHFLPQGHAFLPPLSPHLDS